jgi:putative ABC transport system permease protein
MLPQRIRSEIEQLAPEGYVTCVNRFTWFGGRIEGAQEFFPNGAVDRDTFAQAYSEHGLTDEENKAFQDERRGAIVGAQLAKTMNWKVGDRVTLKGELPPYAKMEFIIVAIPEKMDEPWFYFGLDYYDDVMRDMTGEAAGVHNFWLKCSSPQAREWALTEIDKHFANTDYETRTEMESTFIAQFAKSGGDWVAMTWNIGQLIVLVAVAVAFNTMSMAFRERTREIAVLRALGFSGFKIATMVLLEGGIIGLLGGLVATGPIYVLGRVLNIQFPGAGSVRIGDETALIALAVAVACGLLAAVIPAVMAGRLRVAAALRKVV